MSAETTAAPRPRRTRQNTLLKRLINRRRAVQAGLGIATWFVVTRYGLSLWWVFFAAIASGLVLGKYFCRWACPMGAIMEIMLGAGGEENKQKSLYSYFKIGCPISWAGGLLNKLSVLRVKVDESKCTHCSVCDKACYVAQLADGRSLHEGGKVNASTHYSCSRCLGCVKACPSGALSVGPSWPFGTVIPSQNLLRASEPEEADDSMALQALAADAPVAAVDAGRALAQVRVERPRRNRRKRR